MSLTPLASGRATRLADGGLHITMVAPANTATGPVPLAATCTCTGFLGQVTDLAHGSQVLETHLKQARAAARSRQPALF